MLGLRKIIIRDETLREGTQQAKIDLTQKDRLKIALLSTQLLESSDSKFRNQIDLGMPEASSFLLQTIKKTAAELQNYNIDVFVTGTARKKAIQAMSKALEILPDHKKIIAPFLGISQLHREKLGLTKLQTLKKALEVVKFAKQYCSRINFPLEGGYYAYLEEPKFVLELLGELEEAGVECIPFCDTVGTALPFSGERIISYGEAVKEIKNNFLKLKISVHCHDDLGLAVANSLEGIIFGEAEVVDGTFLGLGERCGNASLETLLVILKTKGQELGLKINANISNLYATSQKIADILEIKIPPNKPVIGSNAFYHVAGIHQDGTLKNKRSYESFQPKKIGRRGHQIVLGRLSGKNGIRHILQKNFRIKNVEDKTLNQVIRRFKNLKNFKHYDPEKILLKILNQVLLNNLKKKNK